jgi:hypothetical protein
MRVNIGPFHIFAIIKGHRGNVVAEFVKEHLMEVILRNEKIMKHRSFETGLK